MSHLRRNAVAYLALFVALGGTSYAAVKITGKDVKNGSLTGKDVRDGSLGATELSFKARGAAGPTGPKGDPGTKGDTGPAATPTYVTVSDKRPLSISSHLAREEFVACPDGDLAIRGANDVTGEAQPYVVDDTVTTSRYTVKIDNTSDHTIGGVISLAVTCAALNVPAPTPP